MPVFEIDGFAMQYRERGRGPVALLIHGFPLDSTVWLDQLDGLADLRTLVAPDLRGFGRSGPSPAPLTMERHAADLLLLADHLGADQVDLVGLSMGGYVALAFAELHPSRIRSLALVDTRATADDERARANRDTAAVRAVVQGRSAFAVETMESLLGPDASLRAKARLRTMVEGTPVESIVAALEGMRDRADRSPVVASIAAPLLVVVGEHERLTTPADARTMVDAALGAVLTVIPGSGHLTPIEQPERLSMALREFWS